jgi:hypothetical protein
VGGVAGVVVGVVVRVLLCVADVVEGVVRVVAATTVCEMGVTASCPPHPTTSTTMAKQPLAPTRRPATIAECSLSTGTSTRSERQVCTQPVTGGAVLGVSGPEDVSSMNGSQ